MRFYGLVTVAVSFTLVATAESFTIVSYNVWNGFNKRSAIEPGIAGDQVLELAYLIADALQAVKDDFSADDSTNSETPS